MMPRRRALTALTAILAASMFVGAPSAMAESTSLCSGDGSGCTVTHVHETTLSGAKAKLLTSIITVSCDVLFLGNTVEATSTPLVIEGNLTYSNCGGCTVTEENGPATLEVLRLGHETADVTGEGEIHVNCVGLNCYYNEEELLGTGKGPLLSSETNGSVSISEQNVKKVKGLFCPSTNKLDITTTPLSATYIGSGGGGGLTATSTSISTSLKGGGKEGAEITVAEGSKVKDTATLSGENASKATGTVDYAVYKDKECKELATKAGEVTVKEGKAPDSEEKELEAGKEYFWQAKYLGDSMNNESTSTCSKEVLKVKAKVTLATKLSGGGKEGEEITVAEGSKVKDTATLSGTNASGATGTVDYSVYKDKECKELASEAGKGKVEGTKAASSEEKELEAGAVYYWQAKYLGDSLHEESTSTCSKEVLTVKAKTTLATKLVGGGKEGEEITVAEGSKAKDTASLSGTKSGTATGTVKYKVYKDKECTELATNAGEVSVSGGSVPNSEEKELEAGKEYFWQAEYGGDSLHEAATSTCSKEVLKVKAKVTLATKLSGGGKEGEEITVAEGSKVKDTATLSGTNASGATGTVDYSVYKDKECKELASEAGKGKVEGTKAASSEEKELEAGAVYYWQAKYLGDSLHEESTSTCSKEVLTVKAATTLKTTLYGSGEEGKEITVAVGGTVIDTTALTGTKSAAATGTVKYAVYSDSKCEKLVTEAGEVSVEEGEVPPSEEEELEAGIYHWQVSYGGDSLHEASTSACDEIATIVAGTSIATSLSGEGGKGEEGVEEGIESEITVAEGAAVTDTATLSGTNVSEATGTVEYSVYSDDECEELAAESNEVVVEGPAVPPSEGVILEPGIYFWQAVYSGDSSNYASTGPCGAEIAVVTPRITTTLSGGEESEEEIEVLEGTPVSDEATLHGGSSSKATGTVEYFVYSDEKCEELAAKAGKVTVEGADAPPSEEEELEAGTYYWQAEYSGDAENPPATSQCGEEIAVIVTSTSLTTSLSGGSEEGSEIEVEEGTAVSDQATLSGPNASSAEGEVEYAVYSDSKCTDLVELAGDVQVTEGEVPASSEVTLPVGTYYWKAEYTGDGLNHPASGACGSEIAKVTWPLTLNLTAGEESGDEIEVVEEVPVVGKATLHGEHASEATGTVEYFVYSDEKCEELAAKAGKVTVEGAGAPASEEEELKSGTYYWQARYSGDAQNPPSTSRCGPVQVFVINPATDKYAALGDSYSSGEGVEHADGFGHPPGSYYAATTAPALQRPGPFMNRCHRSAAAWPGLVANAIYGPAANATAEANVLKSQPDKFIFRACSGAVTLNVWRAQAPQNFSGQWDEFLLGAFNNWIHRPSQALWLTLQGGVLGAANPNIKLLTMTIGGNDAGFAKVAAACVQWPRQILYSPQHCINVIGREEANGFAAIVNRLPLVLQAERQLAPNARIRIPMYPRPVDWLLGGNLPIGPLGGGVLRLNNTVPWPEPLGETAAKAIDRFVWRLNEKIVQVVAAWEAANGGDVKVVPGTEEALADHRIGDPQPWLNRIVVRHVVESFHPNVCGHKALALEILAVVRGGLGAPPARC